MSDEGVNYEALSYRVRVLGRSIAEHGQELTQFGADVEQLRQVVKLLKENGSEALETARALAVCVQGFAQRLIALEGIVHHLMEGKPDDRSEGPHDPTPRSHGHGDLGGSDHPGGR